MNFDDTESEEDEPQQPQEPVEPPAPAPAPAPSETAALPSAATLLDAEDTPDYVVTQTSVNGLEPIQETATPAVSRRRRRSATPAKKRPRKSAS